MPVMEEKAVKRLERRTVTPLDPNGGYAIKRDVHEFEVGCAAEDLVRSFQQVLTDPEGAFGLIRVKRPAARLGQDFVVGDRFQGCFSIQRALEIRFGSIHWLARVCRRPLLQRLSEAAEDQFLSDYGEIDCLELDPEPAEPYRLRYRYLSGTPLAGSSTFLVQALGPKRARVTQIFEYQEENGFASFILQRLGLKLHNQVVAEEVRQAAQRIGAPILSGTIPGEYQTMVGLQAA